MATKNQSLATRTTEALDLVSQEAVDAFVKPITAESLKGVTIERLVKLQAGQQVEGTYVGPGDIVETVDQMTGEVRELATHRIEVAPGMCVRLIESHQLRRSLPKFAGKRVRVMLLGQVDSRRGNRVNDYIVAEVTA